MFSRPARAKISNTLKVYFSLPEMRLFWVFLFLLLVILIVDLAEFGEIGLFVKAGIFFVLGIVIFLNNLRLARSNLEIKVERNQFWSVVSNLKDGIVAYDPNFKILIFNPAAEQIFGVAENEVLKEIFDPAKVPGRRFERLAQAMFPSLAPLVVSRSAPGVYPQVNDLSFSDPEMELRVITDRVIDPAGRLLGFLKIVRDRTREKELLRQKSEFITVAAHQLRTPLTGIAWSFEELAKEPPPEEAKTMVANGLESSRRLLDAINDLLDVAKIEEGRFGYQFSSLELVGFMEEALSKTAALAQNYGVKIYFERPLEAAVSVYADPQKLAVAVSNILDNAVKYNVKGGEVTVKIERLKDSPYAKLSFVDTGIGIPADDLNKIFTKFFRSENVKKVETEGSGLGLYIAKNIVRRHGGKIWAESVLNRGSVFYFTLPTDRNLVPAKEIIYEEE